MLARRLRRSSGESALYLYNLGDECTGVSGGWVAGFEDDNDDGTQSKESDHLYLYALGKGLSERGECTYVTTNTIDLAAYNSLKIEWKNTGNNDSDNHSYLVASTNKTASHSTSNASLLLDSQFDTISTLDISGLSGSYYVRVHAFEDDGMDFYSTKSILNVYNIWLE